MWKISCQYFYVLYNNNDEYTLKFMNINALWKIFSNIEGFSDYINDNLFNNFNNSPKCILTTNE